jgi:signal transduction histidine kinase
MTAKASCKAAAPPAAPAAPTDEFEVLEVRCRQLQALFARTAAAAEKDRVRVARQIHDGIAQKLTALSLDLTLLEQALRKGETPATDRGAVFQRLKSVSTHAAMAVQMARKITSELHSRTLEDFGLAAALEGYLAEFRERLGIQTSFTQEGGELDLETASARQVFRIAQEALLNAARHAHATRVEARLTGRGGWLCLQIQDDGCGIGEEAIAAPESLGLAEMRERAAQLGGSLKVTGIPADGTLVVLRLPLRPASRPAPGCAPISHVC